MDGFLRRTVSLDGSSKDLGQQNDYAVVALGGYGREELCFHSDIDLMFLMPEKCNGDIQDITGRILYPLWDAGLTVGYCNRTLKDCIAMMKDDITIRTSLMEMRYLMGNQDLFRKSQESIFKNAVSKGVNFFVNELLKDMKARHGSYGDSIYYLEPHIKEGKGGLRDIQSALWLAKVRFQAGNVHHLKEKGVLSSWEISLLEECLEYLWMVRTGLHLISGRGNDHLAFEHQKKIAALLGYCDTDPTNMVRSFMHDYYRCTENAKYLSSVLIDRSLNNGKVAGRIRKRRFFKKMEPGFCVKDDKIYVTDPNLLKNEPLTLMKVFEYSTDLRLGIHLETQDLVRNNLDEIDDEFRKSMKVNRSFLSIVEKKNSVAETLKTMHRLGVLGKFIPEFGCITHLPQSPHHHVYTADAHTLCAIEECENLLSGRYGKVFPFLSKLVKEENRPDLVFLGLLVHDLGKVFETDHVKHGEQIAYTICKRLGLSQDDTDIIIFLVKNHIYMSAIAQTRDLSDEHLIIKFAQNMQDTDRLRMLYILTFADMKASRAEAFNSWKAGLFQELYVRAFHILEKGDFTMTDVACKLDHIKSEVMRELRPKMPTDDIQYNFDLTPSRYLLNNSPEVISNHILLCYNLEDKALAFDVRHKLDKGYYDIFIATPDFHGLFSKVCGVMVYHNMNILDAQIDTRSDGIAIDLLRVNYLYRDENVAEEEWKAIQEDLEKAIDGRINVEDLVRKKESYIHPKGKGIQRIKTAIHIDNNSSDFYTIIDVKTSDRFGLLYIITKAMFDMGISIYIAKISTSLTHVTDSFYVRDIFGQKIYDEKTLKKVRGTLMKVLES